MPEAAPGERLTQAVVVTLADLAHADGCWRLCVCNGTELPIVRVRAFLFRDNVLLQSGSDDTFTLADGQSCTVHVIDPCPAGDVWLSGHMFGVSFRDLLGNAWAKRGDGVTTETDFRADVPEISSNIFFSA